jgi:hypothetical protein
VRELVSHSLKRELVSLENQLTTASEIKIGAYKDQLARESNILLETHKSRLATASAEGIEILRSELQKDLQARLEIAKARQPAYKTLWALMLCVRKFNPIPLETSLREKLGTDLTAWYYADGNGMFLSMKATDRFLNARELLKAESGATDHSIRDAFSTLRTQMEIDLAVYDFDAWLVTLGPKSN